MFDRTGEPGRGTDLQEAAFASEDAFWAAYRCACLGAVLEPVSATEQDQLGPLAQRMAGYLGLSAQAAGYQARRALFCYRQEWIHSEMVLELPPQAVATLLDSMEVVGLAQVPRPASGQGILLTALHYSLYSSLLWLWLCRATAQGLYRRLTIMLIPDKPGLVARMTRQLRRLEAAGLVAPGAVTVIERTRAAAFAPAVVRELLARLRAGEAVYFCAEPYFLDITDRHATVLTLGRAPLALPGGVPWLARAAACPVVPVYVRPGAADRYVLTFGPAARPGPPGDGAGGKVALQYLLDQTVLVDPAHWEGWVWVPEAPARTGPDLGREPGPAVLSGAVSPNH